jgi:hypothetical protein
MRTAQQIAAGKRDLFFAQLAEHGQITRAATEAGIDRSEAYKTRDSNPEFAERWFTALERYVDGLEEAARKRAVDGTDKGVYHQGVLMATEKQYSDSLLALMLKAKRPREYGDKSKVELTGADGGPVAIEETPTQIARKIAFALAIGLRNKDQQLEDGTDLA